MAVACLFTCDACGNSGLGVPGDYLYPDPPNGWIWWWGGGMRSEGPHACSTTCWDKVKHSPDGKVYLPDSHERREKHEREAAARRAEPQHPPPPPPAKPEKATWVYFAQRGENGPIKIGMSKHPVSRVKDLGAANAEGLRLLGVVPGGRRQEVELHTLFSGARLNGEWFRPVLDLKDYIATHATMP
jgi:hypothetical protein